VLAAGPLPISASANPLAEENRSAGTRAERFVDCSIDSLGDRRADLAHVWHLALQPFRGDGLGRGPSEWRSPVSIS